MQYMIAAHPTTYAGVNFRSRLEARWAAFFNLLGWQWEYEPVDLEGWVPDFEITIPCHGNHVYHHHVVLAEVKPFKSLKDFAGLPVDLLNEVSCDVALLGLSPKIAEMRTAFGYDD